ncbi:MAG: cupin domain-containing protein [Acidimicrobiales bacterium]
MERQTVQLQDLVGDVELFARRHWGRCPRLQRAATSTGGGRGEPASRLLSVADVDRFLASAPRRPTVRLLRDGAVIEPATYCTRVRLGGQAMTDVVDPVKVTAAYLAGATVVLQSLHRTWRPVGEVVAGLSAELSHPVQANAYLTPPEERGLAAHEDAHDVLVVQCHGTKRWSVAGLGDLSLHPGDVLYLPAGSQHSATTTDQPSLHLTLGVIPDTVRSIVSQVIDATPDLDRRLPLGYRRRPAADLTPALDEALAAARRALADADPAALADDVLWSRPAPTVPAATLGAAMAATLGPDANLVWRHPADCRLTPAGEGQLLLSFPGGLLRLPDHLAPVLERLAGGEPVPLADLADLDPESRLVLARRLAAEGVVDIVPPAPTP